MKMTKAKRKKWIAEVLKTLSKDTLMAYIDLFCGAGGTTTGIHEACLNGKNIAKVVACVNHDQIAIDSHFANYPEAIHLVEDIRTADITILIELVTAIRKAFPHIRICLWASLECTNFSKAKGGQPRDADSRTLAEHLDRYVEGINPDCIQIENVEEFMSWGPLDEKGKPISRKAGRDYLKWIGHVQSYGYRFDWRILNSADYGAHTSRKRYFAIFAKPHFPVIWPDPSHAKKPYNDSFGSTKPWKAVKEVLDLDDEGNSIFGRKKDLSEKTLARIYAGLIKYVAGGKENFILKYNSTAKNGVHYPPSIDEPCPTVACQNRLGLIKASFIQKYYSGKPEGKVISTDGPAGTITCIDSQSLVQAQFMTKYHGTGENILPVTGPASSITTKDRLALVCAQWLDKQYTGKDNHQGIDAPAGTIMQNDKHCLVSSKWLDRNFSGGGQHQPLDRPAGALMTVPKMNLVSPQWVMNHTFDNTGTPVEDPCPPLLASRRHYYLMNPQWGTEQGTSIDKPCFTLIARMDKAPPYLVATEEGIPAIIIGENDSEYTVKIKEFMAMYGIVDIKMRMLKVKELLKIQGFPDGYILKGNQTDQKKFIGNSVPPKAVKAQVEAIGKELLTMSIAA